MCLCTCPGPRHRTAPVLTRLRLCWRFLSAAPVLINLRRVLSVCRKSVIAIKILNILTPYCSHHIPKCCTTPSHCCLCRELRIQWTGFERTIQGSDLWSAAPGLQPRLRYCYPHFCRSAAPVLTILGFFGFVGVSVFSGFLCYFTTVFTLWSQSIPIFMFVSHNTM